MGWGRCHREGPSSPDPLGLLESSATLLRNSDPDRKGERGTWPLRGEGQEPREEPGE